MKSYYEYSGECLDFYQYLFEFENNNPIDFNKVYQCDVVKKKLKKKDNDQSLSEFKSYLEMFYIKNWGDEIVIGDILVSNEKKLDNKYVGNNKVDQRFKEEKIRTKENGIILDSHTEETTNMDGKNGSTEEISLNVLILDANLVVLPKIMIHTNLY